MKSPISYNTPTASVAAAALAALVLLMSPLDSRAQTKQVEHLDRGLVAITQDEGYLLSWRLLGTEAYGSGFNIYRDGEKLNAAPLTGATMFSDPEGTEGASYTVRAVVGGEEQAASRPARMIERLQGDNAGFFEVPLNRPPVGPRGGSYSPNDASVGDLNGDGEYDLVVKWDPSNAKDNSQAGYTDDVIIDAYTLDGAWLWRINLGPNIRAGAHYTQFMVYDFDGDGISEVMMKTAPGTRDGSGSFLSMGPAANADHAADYRNSGGYVLSGPEYLTVFDGQTGEELATTEYVPVRGNVNDWGDDYGNRVDRFLAGVAYVDGERPSAIFARGYYTRMVVLAWDYRDGELTQRWVFDTDDPEYGPEWVGQGNHQLSVADADNDGKHEIVYGAVVIDDDGTGLHTTGMGHGDALHVTQMIKSDPIPKIFTPHEWDQYGVSLRDADDGTLLFSHDQPGDVGRGAAAELDPEVPGFKFWASSGLGLFDIDGNVVGDRPGPINHVVWWDGDLGRELLDQNFISSWSVANNQATRLLTASGANSINGTKANPNLQADILGDWREEVLFRNADNDALRVYVSTMPTEHRLYTFMHDPVYRVAVAWQNAGYNQPPHPGFFVASAMDFPVPQPDVELAQGELSGCSVTPIQPYVQIAGGELQASSKAFVEIASSVTFSPQPATGGSWSWTGPASFTASGREVTIDDVQEDQEGEYVATYTNECGSQSKHVFTITTADQISRATFAVDMAGADASEGVYLTGHIVDWEIVPMEHETGDIYSYTTRVRRGTAGAYYYLTADNWGDAESARETVPDECVAWYDTDRSFFVGDTDTVIAVRWGSCESFDYEAATPIKHDSPLPKEYSLAQNHPNPFSRSTIITYELPSRGQVDLQVFDIMGRVVAQLVDGEEQTAGLHVVSFEAGDLAAGLYMYRLRSGAWSATRKMLLAQ